MRFLLRVTGGIVLLGAGLALFIFWMIAMVHWLGGVGFILGLILSPGLVIFPFAFWVIEGVFPWMYFGLWAVSWVGTSIYIAGGGGSEASDY